MEQSALQELKKFAKTNGLSVITVDKTQRKKQLGFYVYIFDNKTDKRLYKNQCDELTDYIISHLYMFICRYIAKQLKINI